MVLTRENGDMEIADNRTHIKVSKTTVERLVAPSQGYRLYWDTELKGFGVRVTASGVRSFILQSRIHGKDRRLTIGRFPGITAEEARKNAKQLIGEIAGGGDPIASKQRAKLKAVTLEQAFADYVKIKDLKPSTILDMNKAMEETFSAWKKKPLNKITRRMVEKRYLERASQSKARANVAFRYLRAVFNLAITRYRDSDDKPIIEDNPVRLLSEGRLWRKIQRRRTVLRPDDLKMWVPAILRLGEVPEREPGEGRKTPKLRNGEVHRDLFLFLALTGCRKGEALGLKKDAVDLDRGIVVFRDTKNRTTHELPLTPYLKELLARRIDESPNQWVFASPHDESVPSNFRTSIGRITKETGLTFTPHDLRRLAATSLERLGIPAYTVKAILNHLTGANDVTGGYVQVDEEMMLSALLKLERFILKHAQETPTIIDLETLLTGTSDR